jgi:hypothetical protein
MSGFKVAAIPTAYRGRLYRSRLEAKWAAFFDLMGWQHEYEPYDLGTWSPDFLIIPSGGAHEVLVEVKPITEFDPAVGEKMLKAAVDRGLGDSGRFLLLLGTGPMRLGESVLAGWRCMLLKDFPYEWEGTPIRWVADPDRPELRGDLIHTTAHAPFLESGNDDYWDGLTTGIWHYEGPLPLSYPDHTLRLWAEASNAVQWKGGRR